MDKKVRKFSAWSHVISLLYAQLTHSIGLNDVCDALGLHSGPLSSLRGATPPTRNNLSHANKVRPAEMAEKLFWAVFEHLGNLSPRFISGRDGKRFARRFKRTITKNRETEESENVTEVPAVSQAVGSPRANRAARGYPT